MSDPIALRWRLPNAPALEQLGAVISPQAMDIATLQAIVADLQLRVAALEAGNTNPPINASLTQTMGTIALTGTAIAPLQASLAATLAPAALASTVQVIGGGIASLSASLDPVGFAGTAKAAIAGALAATLAPAALVGTAIAPLGAMLAVTMAAATVASTATVATSGSINASANVTLAAVSLVATVTAPLNASVAQTLAAVALTGSASSPYVGPASNNTLLGNGTVTTTAAAQQTVHQTRVSGGISDMRVALLRAKPGVGKTTPLAASYTVNEISVRLVSGGTIAKLTKGGATSWTVTPWDGTDSDPVVDWCDLTPLGFTLPANTDFYIFESYSGSSFPGFTSTGTAAQMLSSAERLQTGAGAPTTMPAAITSITQTDSTRRTRIGALVGIEATRTGPSVAIIGDSLVVDSTLNLNQSDGDFSDQNRGLIPNMLGNTSVGTGFDYVNLGIGGDQWETRVYDTKIQEALYANATHVVLELGINSFNNKKQPSEAVPITFLKTYLPKLNGKKVVLAQLTPQTDSTGNWTAADGSDQTFTSLGGSTTDLLHAAYNSALALIGPPVLAVRASMGISGNSDKFYADGTANFSTLDGLHHRKAAILRASASYGATAQSIVSSAPTLSAAAAPSKPLTGLTISGGKATNGTGVQNAVVPNGVQPMSIIAKVTLGASISSGHAILPSSTTSFGIKSATISTSRFVNLIAYGGATANGTIALNASATNEIMWVLDGTNIYQFINGVFDVSLAIGSNGNIRNDFSIAASSAKSISLSEVTIWNYARQTSGSYTPTTFTGTETGLIARYPLSTDVNPIFGPATPQ